MQPHEHMSYTYISQQALFVLRDSGERVNVDFHITPHTHCACKLISDVAINEHLHWHSASSDWTFPWADRQVKLQL